MRILVANFFPAFHPPRSGGEQRYFYLYHYLSRTFDVTLVSPTYSDQAPELVAFSRTFREYRVPKDPVFDHLHMRLGADEIGPECSGYVVSLAAAADTQYGRRFEALVGAADLVIHESPFTLPYDSGVGHDGKPRIYNAYNVEHRLAAQIFRGPRARKAVEFIRFLEKSLVDASSLIFVTSEDESDHFVEDFGVSRHAIALVANGFEPDASSADVATDCDGGPAYAVFMGSGHPPNVEAAVYIVDHIAPVLPDLEFRLIGSVCQHLPSALPRNVKSLGFLVETEKRRQLEHCSVALNPLFSGAGTNLKMLDYMSAAAPILCTPIGARGLGLRDGVDAYIESPEHYCAALREIVADRPSARCVGAAARRKAFADYTWERIADRAASAIESVAFKRNGLPSPFHAARPLLLVVNDFPVAEAAGGGQVRIRELLSELGREFDVIFLCMTAEPERFDRALAPGFREVGIPKTAQHRRAEELADRASIISIGDVIASEFCLGNDELVAAFGMYVTRAAAIVFEHPYLAPLLDLVPAEKPVVYSSLNVESDLKTALLEARPDAQSRIRIVKAVERRLLDRADLTVCVSVADRARFFRSHPDGRYVVVENGVRTDRHEHAQTGLHDAAELLRGTTLAVFMGSVHMPNVEAARFLLGSVAPAVPEVTFGIIGSVCDAVRQMPLPGNVMLLGLLDEGEKNAVLALATMAVNPMLEGGGSSLKVPDFFAAGLALISTSVGARGYDLEDGTHYVAADRRNFAEKVRMLAGDPALRRRLANNARSLAERTLDWRALGARYRRALGSLFPASTQARVLVVTYRFADPPPGGAETFLVNVLRELALRGNVAVDVASCDVGAITNKWHFSAHYADAPAQVREPDYVRDVYRFPVESPQADDFDRCRRLFAVWMEESRRQATSLLDRFSQPVLMGGWNFAEVYAGKIARWTSRRAEIYVGERATAIGISGYAPAKMAIDVFHDATRVATRRAEGSFSWTLNLPPKASVITLLADRAFAAAGDPRELGFVVSDVTVLEESVARPIDLGEDFGATMRRLDPRRWVRSLIEVTELRNRVDDDLFVAVRGPHSSRLRRWLEDNVESYDVVLAQGVPFSTPVMVDDVAARHQMPLVLLPHFHMDDRYYHWRRYYEMFRRATCVIAAPEQSKTMFFDVLGAASRTVPGGGVDPGEYNVDRRAAHEAAFLARHHGRKPFALVLGRKAAGKNYHLAIDAVLAANADGHEIDLVMIGPDDDGTPVTAANVHYYGAQPREVVLGALSLATCLVNMSESESFGIVLLEAWLSGTPVIAQRRCIAFADLVASGQNGFLAESSAEIVDALRLYLASPDAAARHAERGRVIAQNYSWQVIAAQIEEILLAAKSSDARRWSTVSV